MNTKIRAAAVAVAVAGAFAAQSAAADNLTFSGFANGSVAATIYNTPSPVGGNPTYTSAGGLSMTNTTAGGTFQAWCVDIFNWLRSSAPYTLVSGSSFYAASPGKVNDLQALATRNLPSVTNNATNSAAFQLAVWEIVNETSGTYNIGSGSFYASSTAAVITAATGMLSNLNAATNNTAQILSVWKETPGYTTQDLAVFAPVPEPETYAMMLAGLGLMGFIARRRTSRQEA